MQLTIQEYSQTAAALSELRDRYANVVFPVETTKGMKDASEARKALREIRVGLEKMRTITRDRKSLNARSKNFWIAKKS